MHVGRHLRDVRTDGRRDGRHPLTKSSVITSPPSVLQNGWCLQGSRLDEIRQACAPHSVCSAGPFSDRCLDRVRRAVLRHRKWSMMRRGDHRRGSPGYSPTPSIPLPPFRALISTLILPLLSAIRFRSIPHVLSTAFRSSYRQPGRCHLQNHTGPYTRHCDRLQTELSHSQLRLAYRVD